MELRQARDVLVCARWGIGDLVMELPLLRALRQHLPEARITALGANPALQLLQGEGIVDGSMAVQQFGFRHWAHVIAPVHLRGTAALLAQCRVLICNDTGLMHLAAAVGTPVVAVFACTSPRLYLPRGGKAVARWAQPCSHVVHDDFGVAPCVAGARCLDPGHRRLPELWADAATAAALRHLP